MSKVTGILALSWFEGPASGCSSTTSRSLLVEWGVSEVTIAGEDELWHVIELFRRIIHSYSRPLSARRPLSSIHLAT